MGQLPEMRGALVVFALAVCALLFASAGWAIAWIFPWLWSLVRPWLHVVTG